MTTANAMKNNTTTNADRKVAGRIALETLYKKGHVGDVIVIADEDLRKSNANNTLVNRVGALAHAVGGPGWAKVRVREDGKVDVCKKSNLRARDRVKATKLKRSNNAYKAVMKEIDPQNVLDNFKQAA